ncbi:MAG: ABC transporter permease [Thermoguttaceae bacterium]
MTTETEVSADSYESGSIGRNDGTLVPPSVIIARKQGWQTLNLGEVWRSHQLLWMFVSRDYKVRYKETAVGLLWVVLQPLIMMLIFTTFFSLLGAQPGVSGVPYSVTTYAGLLLWNLFATAMSKGGDSLFENQALIRKVYFCRLIIPLTPALVGLIDFCAAFSLLVAMMAYFSVGFTWHMFFAPLFVLLTTIFAFTASLWLSALSAAYRDVRIALPFCTQVLFFISPVFYSAYSVVPERWRSLYFLNPLAGIVEGFRWAVFGGTVLPVKGVIFSSISGVLLLIAGLFFFRRMERNIADWV